MTQPINSNQFDEWKTNPVTLAFKDVLKAWREQLRDRLEQGVLLRNNSYENELTSAEIVGNLSVIKQISDLDYDGMMNFLEKE